MQQTLGALVAEIEVLEGAELYLKVGRKVTRIDFWDEAHVANSVT